MRFEADANTRTLKEIAQRSQTEAEPELDGQSDDSDLSAEPSTHSPVARRSFQSADRSVFDQDLSIRPYIHLLLRYRLLLVVAMVVTMGVTVTRILMTPSRYVAKATILPSRGGSNMGVLSLISSFTGGQPVTGMTEEISSYLFPSILESRAVGLEVLRARYRFTVEGKEVERTLLEHLGAKNTDQAFKMLRSIQTLDVHRESGVLTISSRTAYPELSAQIVNKLVENLELTILRMRQETASQNSSFIQDRLDQASADLEEAEQALTEFQEQNVRMNSPELELEFLRLQRDVKLKSQLYITLSNQVEVANIEEAKDLPVVRVLDRASVPELPVPVPRLSSLVVGLIAGILVALMTVAAMEALRYVRREFIACTQP